jgi:hypothetical protein
MELNPWRRTPEPEGLSRLLRHFIIISSDRLTMATALQPTHSLWRGREWEVKGQLPSFIFWCSVRGSPYWPVFYTDVSLASSLVLVEGKYTGASSWPHSSTVSEVYNVFVSLLRIRMYNFMAWCLDKGATFPSHVQTTHYTRPVFMVTILKNVYDTFTYKYSLYVSVDFLSDFVYIYPF